MMGVMGFRFGEGGRGVVVVGVRRDERGDGLRWIEGEGGHVGCGRSKRKKWKQGRRGEGGSIVIFSA
jgi:hypothetical protein